MIAQPLQGGPAEAGIAVVIIAEAVLGRYRPALCHGMPVRTLRLLGNAVGLRCVDTRA
jgi:hypothetical protein